MKKVCKIIGTLDFGGIEKVFALCGKYNTTQKMIFICLGKGGATSDYLSSLGYEVHVLNGNIRIPNFGMILQLRKLLRRIRPDVMHATGAEANFHGILAAWLAGVPLRVGEEIGMPSHSTLAKRIFRFVYGKASAVIAVAESVAAYMRANREVPAEKIRLIYNPVDVDAFLNAPAKTRTDDEFIILTVCRLNQIKNLAALIRVFAKLHERHPQCRLWMVGEGEERGGLEALVRELNLGAYVRFFGYQPDPSAFFRQADVFALPSFSEGHPVSLVEAMISEVPVVATKIGGAAEMITNGVNGWLIDPNDDNDILAKIENVIRLSPDERKRIAASSRQQAIGNFSPREYLSRLDDLYLSLMNTR